MTKYDRRIERLEAKRRPNRAPVLVVETRDGLEYHRGSDRLVTDEERDGAELILHVEYYDSAPASFRDSMHNKQTV